jgi:hypothetical protein
MIESNPETKGMLLRTVAGIEELRVPLEQAVKEQAEKEQRKITEQAQSEPAALVQLEAAEKAALAKSEEVRLKTEAEQNELKRKSQIEIRIPLIAALRHADYVKDLALLKETAQSLLQTFEKGKLNDTDLASLHPINDILTRYDDADIKGYIEKFESLKTPSSGGKTLRKRAVYNKTRTKLNRKSRRNRYK